MQVLTDQKTWDLPKPGLIEIENTVNFSNLTEFIRPYFDLLKPRVSSLVVVTTATGFYLASDSPLDSWALIYTVLATALLAGGAVCLNQVLERHADAQMDRTSGRPLPTAQLRVITATLYGVLLLLSGTLILSFKIDILPAMLGLASSLIYLFAYTPLKGKTPFCTTVGAFPGAIPPLIGWTAAKGQLTIEAWTLFGILFLWQYPHFLAIAWIYRDDYRRGGFKMLPLMDTSGRRTAVQIVIFTFLLGCLSIFPWGLEHAGNIYLGSAVVLSLAFLTTSLILLRTPTQVCAGYVIRASIVYLPLLLLMLALDRL